MSPKFLRNAGLVAACLVAAAASTLLARDPLLKAWNVEEYRKKYPIQSLSNRLAALSRYSTQNDLPEATDKRLAEVEKMLDQEVHGPARVQSMKMLHSNEVNAFIERNGNGYRRMAVWDPSPSHWDLPEAPIVELEKLHSAEVDDFVKRPGNGFDRIERLDIPRENPAWVSVTQESKAPEGNPLRWPTADLLTTFHNRGTVNFVNVAGFGYVKDREHVVGFQEHQFRSMPEVQPIQPGAKEKPKERWVIRRLELVSLLMHETPVAYVSEHLPRMGEMKKVKTRPLSTFEEKSLKAIEKGEDVVAEALPNQMRMMGAIRANKQCLHCHEVSRGELLGTFSYDLQRVPAIEGNYQLKAVQADK